MNIEQKIGAIASRRRFGMKPGLERMKALLAALGNPERDIIAIHIAGTNGKGSVAAMTASILSASGIGKIGRYTSPHLVFFNERITIDGVPVSNDLLEAALDKLIAVIEYLDKKNQYATFFECATALAFDIFRTQGVRLAVIETGLGGRLDATNILTPFVSVITNVGLEHCEYLGDTIEKIAFEKAGIIKPSRPVIPGVMSDDARAVITEVAASVNAPIFDCSPNISVRHKKDGRETITIEDDFRTVSSIKFALHGAYQLENTATAINVIEAFSQLTSVEITDKAVKDGLESVVWPCRFQQISDNPPIITDGAHNPPAAAALASSISKRGGPKILVAGFCTDKDILTTLRIMKPYFKCAIATESTSPRAKAADELSSVMKQAGFVKCKAIPDRREAMKEAVNRAQEENASIVVMGSLFLAGAIAEDFNAIPMINGVRIGNEIFKAAK